nr:MAG TPA_asm: hypothetical protein [Bacteriophage sp.]
MKIYLLFRNNLQNIQKKSFQILISSLAIQKNLQLPLLNKM